jgi:RNA polymerase sigma factor (sigma-70 family)
MPQPATPTTGFSRDLERCRFIVEGDVRAWHSFVEEYGDRITWTAYRWCRPGCWRGPCPVTRGYRLLSARLDCDEIRDAALYILSKIRGTVLRVYRGQCSLASFLYPILNPAPDSVKHGNARYGYRQLFAGYLLENGGERLRPPKAIAKLPAGHQEVFEDLFRGLNSDALCRQRGLSDDAYQGIRRDIEKALQRSGAPGWRMCYRLFGPRPRVVPLPEASAGAAGEDSRPMEFADPGPLQDMQAVSLELENALSDALARLHRSEREILRLMYQQGLPARQAAKMLGIPQRRAYYDLNQALIQLEAELRRYVFAPEVSRGKAPVTGAFRALLKQYFHDVAADN